MKHTKIWLNHWFSTAYNIIHLIKENESNFYIIGSNERANSVIQTACDEWYQEPVLKGMDYVEYCIQFCKDHAIDIFMPRRGMLDISQNIHLFHEIGTQVMVDDYEIIAILNRKDASYELFKDKGIGIVPDYRIVTTIEEYLAAYDELSSKYIQLCFKFVSDEGGQSFHVIDNKKIAYQDLFHPQGMRISHEELVRILHEQQTFAPIMLMPYLPEQEVSVDCLQTEQGVIMLPRVKEAFKVERLVFDEQILAICRDFYAKVGLVHPCNIQFKYLDGIPYFLEVNTRMSGGVQMSCMAAGVNIPNIAVNKMLGISKQWEIDKTEKMVSHVLMPVAL